jgi:hypothetical protein
MDTKGLGLPRVAAVTLFFSHLLLSSLAIPKQSLDSKE